MTGQQEMMATHTPEPQNAVDSKPVSSAATRLLPSESGMGCLAGGCVVVISGSDERPLLTRETCGKKIRSTR